MGRERSQWSLGARLTYKAFNLLLGFKGGKIMSNSKTVATGAIWDISNFNKGVNARLAGSPLISAPAPDSIGQWCHLSWCAGWADASSKLIADYEIYLKNKACRQAAASTVLKRNVVSEAHT